MILQTDLIGVEASRLCNKGAGVCWIIHAQELAAVPGSALREPIGSLAAHRDEIKRALDILIDGV